MRWRSVHATPVYATPFAATCSATALVLVWTTFARAQDIDVFGDLYAPAPPAHAALPVSVDKTPTGSLGRPSLTPEPVRPAPSPDVPVAARKTFDPDIDGVTKPATPAPSKDPLDAPGAAKPVVPKADAAKPDVAKPDIAKPDIAKPDATKPGPAKPAATTPATGEPPKPDGQPAAVVVPPPPLAPLNAAIKAALDKRAVADIRGAQAGERRKERKAIAAYYEGRGYAPTWSRDGAAGAAVESVLTRLAKAAEDALTIPAPPAKLVANGTPDEIAASEIALTEVVVAYARQASGARVDPAAISPLIGARPELADPGKVVDRLVAAGTAAGDALAALNPSEPRYVALREKLAAMHGTQAGSAQPIPQGPTLAIGMHDARVPLLRARFNIVALDLVDEPTEYDVAIAEAVSGFQRSSGLPVTGKLDHRTVAAMAGGGKASPQEAVVVANMEMWRWMPHDLGRDRIEVDVPAFKVTLFHDGEAAATNRVVVGKTDTPTPIFSNVMKYLIVNPVWNVPQSIIKKEMMAKIDAGGGGLRGFDVSYRHGQLVVKQPSGAKNALGRIKFMFPNDFSVYLHDTPSKALFSASRRAFSHGCVRVDQPFDFAFNVLNDSVPEGGKVLWSEKRLDSLLGDKERYVNLPKPLPIHIEYFTASVDSETGRLVQREDIYGYAREVARALGLESGPSFVAERKPRRTVKAAVAKAAVAKAAVDVDVDEDPR